MHVTLIAAQSLDGYITYHAKPGSAFTSEADKQHFRAALKQFDCRVMGSETYRVTRDMTRRAAAAGVLVIVVTRDPSRYADEALPGRLLFSSGSPGEILVQLEQAGRKRCALLGGSKTHSFFLAAKVIDEIWLTIEPRLFGGGTRLLDEPTDTVLQLLGRELLGGDTLLLRYAVGRRS